MFFTMFEPKSQTMEQKISIKRQFCISYCAAKRSLEHNARETEANFVHTVPPWHSAQTAVTSGKNHKQVLIIAKWDVSGSQRTRVHLSAWTPPPRLFSSTHHCRQHCWTSANPSPSQVLSTATSSAGPHSHQKPVPTAQHTSKPLNNPDWFPFSWALPQPHK